MSKIKTEEFINHPKFKQLVSARSRLSVQFSLLVFVGYSIFVLGMAYAPGWMSTPMATGSSITYGIVIGVFMIIFGMVSSGLYMKVANQKFDVLKQQLLKEFDYE